MTGSTPAETDPEPERESGTGLVAAGAGAEVRVLRLMSTVLGLAGLAAAATAVPALLAQGGSFEPWWTALALASLIGLPLVLAASSWGASGRRLRAQAGLLAGGGLLSLALIDAGLRQGSLPPGLGAPWLLGLVPIAAIAAALAVPGAAAIAYSIATAGLVGLERVLAYPDSILDVALQDAMVSLLLQTVFVALVLVCRRAARRLDQVASAAREEAASAAGALTRASERMRLEAFIHDHVLSTLLLASRDTGRLRSLIRRDAERSRQAIADYGAPPPAPASAPAVTDGALVWRLQATTSEIAPLAAFEHSGATAAEVPPAVAEAITGAAAEALRNSVRHGGGTGTSRAVVAELSRGAIRVLVLDDGPGFDVESRPEGRFGVAVSILGRMAAVPGGRAAVRSRPGHGTVVQLDWRRDDGG